VPFIFPLFVFAWSNRGGKRRGEGKKGESVEGKEEKEKSSVPRSLNGIMPSF